MLTHFDQLPMHTPHNPIDGQRKITQNKYIRFHCMDLVFARMPATTIASGRSITGHCTLENHACPHYTRRFIINLHLLSLRCRVFHVSFCAFVTEFIEHLRGKLARLERKISKQHTHTEKTERNKRKKAKNAAEWKRCKSKE